MTDPTRFAVVREDPEDRTIVGGPYLWDGATEWQPAEQGRLIREADALGEGYTYPST